MKKAHPPNAKKISRPARRETFALTPEQMAEMATQIFWGDGRQDGRVMEHWPETEVQMLAGLPANRMAL